jgi:uncharacterized protein YggE
MQAPRSLVSLSALAALLALAGAGGGEQAGASAAQASSARTVTVSGSGSVAAVPTRAAFSFGVVAQGRTASLALAANAGEMRKVVAALRAAGVARKDIQTAAVSLSPRYSRDGEEILGYTASNTVSATVRGVERAGSVIDAAVQAGANQVLGPLFTRADEAALYRRALRAAVADARAKAQALAAAAGLRLGPVRSLVEGSGPIPVSDRPAKAAEATPIEPGTQTIQATVTVELALR